MNRKNIFKTLAAAMLMPAMLLTTSCSSEDDALNTPAENIAKKGYTFPVTINVTRQGDAAGTRASFNETSKKLEFTAGDKLFVCGSQATAGGFAGTLDYVSDGTFSGTISTENEYSGTIDDLFASAYAYLLPDGYGSYGCLSVSGSGYGASYHYEMTKAFALTKAAAVEQFSREWAYEYSGGFALEPDNAILNFTVNGLAASTEVAVAFTYEYDDITGNVTTDASGTATFAIGLLQNINLNKCTLTVGGNAITLVSESKVVEAGKIYNITRSAAAAARTLSEATAEDVGKIVGADGKIYDTKADAEAVATGNAVAMIAYVNGSNGLAIQLNGSPESKKWKDGDDYPAEAYAKGLTAVPGGTWRLPSKEDWQNMFVGCAVSEDASAGDSMNPIAGFKAKIAATGITWQSGTYWSSTPSGSDGYDCWYVDVFLNSSNALAYFHESVASPQHYVLGCLAF